MAKTTVTRLSYATGDNDLPLFCDDPSAQMRGTTDFLFDWRAAAQYAAVAVPAVGQPIPDATFRNLAIDASPILARTVASRVEQAIPANGDRNLADGDGLALLTGQPNIYVLRRDGTPDGEVASGKAEGFRSFYIDLWTRVRVLPGALGGLLGRGNGAAIEHGLLVRPNGELLLEVVNGGRSLGMIVAGTLLHIGYAIDFDTAADTATLRAFVDGEEVGAAAPMQSPSGFPAPGASFAIGAAGGYGYTEQTIARLSRTYTAWPGQGALDPLALHQAEEQVNRSRLA